METAITDTKGKAAKAAAQPRIVHFEIPADDPARAGKFYSALFGWKIKKEAGLDDYWMIDTGVKDAVGGGLMKRQTPGQQITCYIDVPSVDEYSKKAEGLGGKVAVRKTAVRNWGWFAICIDAEGNSFGLWEDDKSAA